jgi:hypothetical protein
MRRICWALAVAVLVLVGAATLTAFVTADNREEELLAVVLLGVPTATLTLLLGARPSRLLRRVSDTWSAGCCSPSPVLW